MDWNAWIPALLSSGVLAAVSVAGAQIMKSGIEKGIQHGLDRELERLKAQLRTKDDQINAIRSTALSALTSRHEALDQRRLKAAEALWSATVYQMKFKMAVGFVSTLKIDVALKASAQRDNDGEKMRGFGKGLWEASAIDKLMNEQPSVADTERLFVPPLAWAAFEAYRSITAHAVIIIGLIKAGGADLLKGNDPIVKAVKLILPHRSEFLDKNGESGIYYLVDELQEKVFTELVASFSDPNAGQRVIDQASDIIRYADSKPSPVVSADLPAKFVAEKPAL
ncbi:hypothetical protein EN873_04705 [bacterium M00.F.Ca.ET.230.01.1.1]|nr:hypothetical protein EN873_04705 [bacterium M00.F.Ca.ET.230.01.1.1]